MQTEDDTFYALKKWPIQKFRNYVLCNSWNFCGDLGERDYECRIRGWTWNEYCKEFARLYSLGEIK